MRCLIFYVVLIRPLSFFITREYISKSVNGGRKGWASSVHSRGEGERLSSNRCPSEVVQGGWFRSKVAVVVHLAIHQGMAPPRSHGMFALSQRSTCCTPLRHALFPNAENIYIYIYVDTI